jgi:hypothetical protein
VWKEHTCAGCGCVYRYLLRCRKTARGPSESAAAQQARQAVVAAILQEVALAPCPRCGLYQRDMVAAHRARWHGTLTWASLPVLLVPVVLGALDVLPLDVAAWSAAGVGGALVLGHGWLNYRNRNRNRAANRRLAEKLLARGEVEEQLPPTRDAEEVREAGRPARTACLGALLLSVALVAGGELFRVAAGWPANRDWRPAVAGPGDEARIYFPERFSSPDGWSTQALVEVVNAVEVGLPPGTMLTATSPEGRDTPGPAQLWARVHLPPADDLAGKALRLRLQIVVMPRTERQAPAAPRSFYRTAELRLAPAGAGRTYRVGWWCGVVAGSVVLLAGGAWLKKINDEIVRGAEPPRIIPYQTGAARVDDGPALP